MTDYIIAQSEKEYKITSALFKEYAVWLNVDLGFQNFEEELQRLKEMYAAPYGGIALCKKENDFIACVAIRRIKAAVCTAHLSGYGI